VIDIFAFENDTQRKCNDIQLADGVAMQGYNV